jgi:hypothetical protein
MDVFATPGAVKMDILRRLRQRKIGTVMLRGDIVLLDEPRFLQRVKRSVNGGQADLRIQAFGGVINVFSREAGFVFRDHIQHRPALGCHPKAAALEYLEAFVLIGHWCVLFPAVGAPTANDFHLQLSRSVAWVYSDECEPSGMTNDKN